MRHTKILFSETEKYLEELASALSIENFSEIYELGSALDSGIRFIYPFHQNDSETTGKTILVYDFPLTGKTCLAYNLAKIWMQANWAINKVKSSTSVIQPENLFDLNTQLLDNEISNFVTGAGNIVQNLIVIDDFEEILNRGTNPELFLNWATKPNRYAHKIIVVSEGIFQDVKFNINLGAKASSDTLLITKTNYEVPDLAKFISLNSFRDKNSYELPELITSLSQVVASKITAYNREGNNSYLVGLIESDTNIRYEKLHHTKIYQNILVQNDVLRLLQTLNVIHASNFFNDEIGVSDEILRDLYCTVYDGNLKDFERAIEKLSLANLINRVDGNIKISRVWMWFVETFESTKTINLALLEEYIRNAAIQFSRPFSYFQLGMALIGVQSIPLAVTILSKCSDSTLRRKAIAVILENILPDDEPMTVPLIKKVTQTFFQQIFSSYISIKTNADPFAKYEILLLIAEKHIGPSVTSFDIQRHRLIANIEKSKRYGDTDNRLAERNEIIYNIDELLKDSNVSFTNLYEDFSTIESNFLYTFFQHNVVTIYDVQIIQELCDAAVSRFSNLLKNLDISLKELSEEIATWVAVQKKNDKLVETILLKNEIQLVIDEKKLESSTYSMDENTATIAPPKIPLRTLISTHPQDQIFNQEELNLLFGIYKTQKGLSENEYFISISDFCASLIWEDLDHFVAELAQNCEHDHQGSSFNAILGFVNKLIQSPDRNYIARVLALATLMVTGKKSDKFERLLVSIHNEHGSLLYCQALIVAQLRIYYHHLTKHPAVIDDSLWLSPFQNESSRINIELILYKNFCLTFLEKIGISVEVTHLQNQINLLSQLEEKYIERFFLIENLFSKGNDNKLLEDLIEKWHGQVLGNPGWENYFFLGVLYFAKDCYAYGNIQQSNQLIKIAIAITEDYKLYSEEKALNEEIELISVRNSVPKFSNIPAPSEFPIKDEYLKKIIPMIQFNQIGKSMEKINTYISGNEYNYEAWYLLGICYKRLNDDLKAMECFNNCIDLDIKFIPAYIQVALIYQKLEKKDLEIVTLKRAKAIDLTNFDVNFNLGIAYGQKGQHKKAVEHLLYAQNAIPRNDDSRNNTIRRNLAVGYKYLRKRRKALNVYMTGFRTNHYNTQLLPNFLDIVKEMKGKGELTYKNHSLDQGKFIYALLDYMVNHSANYQDLVAISSTYFHFDDMQNGWKIYRKIFDFLSQQKLVVDPLDLISNLLIRAGKPKHANYYLGIKKLQIYSFEEAIINLDQYAQDFPNHTEVYYHLGKAYFELSKSQLSLNLLENVDFHLELALLNAFKARCVGSLRSLSNSLIGDVYLMKAKLGLKEFTKPALRIFNELYFEFGDMQILARVLTAKFQQWVDNNITDNYQSLVTSFNNEIFEFIERYSGSGKISKKEHRVEFYAVASSILLEFYEILNLTATENNDDKMKICNQYLTKAGNSIRKFITNADYKSHISLGKIYWEKHFLVITGDSQRNKMKISLINKSIEEWQIAQGLVQKTILSRNERTVREELEIMLGSARKKLKILARLD